MLGEAACEFGVVGLDELVHVEEVLDALSIHLELDFVENQAGLVLPVHLL